MNEKRAPGGRPPFEPTQEQRELVEILVSNGNSERTIALAIGHDRKTVRRAFRDELRNGRERVTAAMGAALVKAGLAGNVHALKYWLGTHGGQEWRVTEGRVVENVGIEREVRDLTDEELEERLAELDRKWRIVAGEKPPPVKRPRDGSVH